VLFASAGRQIFFGINGNMRKVISWQNEKVKFFKNRNAAMQVLLTQTEPATKQNPFPA